MRTMEFTVEKLNAMEVGQELGVTEGILPSSYYYTLEHALGMSGNFSSRERLKSKSGKVVELKKTPKFNIAVLEFDE